MTPVPSLLYPNIQSYIMETYATKKASGGQVSVEYLQLKLRKILGKNI